MFIDIDGYEVSDIVFAEKPVIFREGILIIQIITSS